MASHKLLYVHKRFWSNYVENVANGSKNAKTISRRQELHNCNAKKNSHHTVWKFHDFPTTEILHEISMLKTTILTTLKASNFDFWGFHTTKGKKFTIMKNSGLVKWSKLQCLIFRNESKLISHKIRVAGK